MSNRLRAAALALTLAALPAGGCASMITGGPLVTGTRPTAQIVIDNQSGVGVNVVLLSTCSASTYGLNRLPSGLTIPYGGSHGFTVDAGCWDVAVGRVGYGDTRERIDVPANTRYVLTVPGV
jgi:hypothetical protein